MSIKSRFLNRVKQRAVDKLKRKDLATQVAFLHEALDKGMLSARELRRQIERNAVREMASVAKKRAASGEALTVEALLGDYNEHPEFKRLAERVGLTEEWFKDMAVQVAKGASEDAIAEEQR